MTYKHATLTLEEENIDFVQKTTNGEYLILLKELSKKEKYLISTHYEKNLGLTLRINHEAVSTVIDINKKLERIIQFDDKILIMVSDYDSLWREQT